MLDTLVSERQQKGRTAYLSGCMAEASVEAAYLRDGCELRNNRWRGQAGEIDLIFQQGDELVFVEVKKSASHDRAALRLGRRQMDRICLAAQEYTERYHPGQPMAMRFDAALVDNFGRIKLLRGAFGMN